MKNINETSVLIVENNALLADTLKEMLREHNITTLAVVIDEEAMMDALKIHKPHVILYDIFLSTRKLKVTISEVKKISPVSQFLILSYETGDAVIDFCFDAGAKGFCDKTLSNIEILAEAINKIYRGERCIYVRETAA